MSGDAQEIIGAPYRAAEPVPPASALPPTWGQLAIGRAIRWFMPADHQFTMWRSVAVPAGRSVADCVAAVGTLVGACGSLRSTFTWGDQWPVARHQAAAGRLPVRVVRADTTDGAAETAALAAEMQAVPFRDEVPVRAGLVTAGTRPLTLTLAVSHIAVDGAALALIAERLRRCLEGETMPTPPGPDEEIAEQRSVAGRRRAERAERSWRDGLAGLPAGELLSPGPAAEQPRFRQVVIESRALARSSRYLAWREHTSVGTVVAAGLADRLARLAGVDRIGLRVVVGNRFTPAHGRAVVPRAQDGLFTLHGAGGADDAGLVARAAAAMLRAHRNAWYDPVVVEEMVTGSGVDVECCFQDRHAGTAAAAPCPDRPTQVELARLREETVTGCAQGWDRRDRTVFARLETESDLLRIRAIVDTRRLGTARANRLLLDVQDWAVRECAR